MVFAMMNCAGGRMRSPKISWRIYISKLIQHGSEVHLRKCQKSAHRTGPRNAEPGRRSGWLCHPRKTGAIWLPAEARPRQHEKFISRCPARLTHGPCPVGRGGQREQLGRSSSRQAPCPGKWGQAKRPLRMLLDAPRLDLWVLLQPKSEVTTWRMPGDRGDSKVVAVLGCGT